MFDDIHCTKKPVTAMLTYPWKCTVLHCNHLGNTWKPLVLMTRLFDYCPSASTSAPVVSRCFPGGYNVKLYISRGMVSMVVTGFFAQCWFSKTFQKSWKLSFIFFHGFYMVHVNSLKAVRVKQKISILWCVTILMLQFDAFIFNSSS